MPAEDDNLHISLYSSTGVELCNAHQSINTMEETFKHDK